MIGCDCNERIDVEINSLKQFEDLKKFFEKKVKEGVFVEVSVKRPYYIGYSIIEKKSIKWYANKWYRCRKCGTLWEFQYPDFPAKGFVRKFPDGKYRSEE